MIASPQMKDPFFERTIVLVWHHDEEGAIGVVINRELSHTLPAVLQFPPDVGDVDLSAYSDVPVGWGGPVDSESGTVVTTGQITDDEGWSLTCGLSVTRSQEALIRLLNEGAKIFLCLGYAGWGPEQLDHEIEQGGWLWTDCDARILFEKEPHERYEFALKTLGLTEHTVWMTPINE